MKVSEIEIGVTFQPRSYESIRGSVRVVLDEGDCIENAVHFAAEQVANIVSAGNPDRYEDCMRLLGRDVSIMAVEKMKAEWEVIQSKISEYKRKLAIDGRSAKSLEQANKYYENLKQILEVANCWAEFEKIMFNLEKADRRQQPNSSEEIVPISRDF